MSDKIAELENEITIRQKDVDSFSLAASRCFTDDATEVFREMAKSAEADIIKLRAELMYERIKLRNYTGKQNSLENSSPGYLAYAAQQNSLERDYLNELADIDNPGGT